MPIGGRAIGGSRLLLIGGCLGLAAAAAAGDFQAGIRAALAGGALVAALLLFRSGATRGRELDPDPGIEASARSRHGLFQRRRAAVLETRLSAIVRQLDGYEQKLGDVSRAHTLAEIETRTQLTKLHQRLAELEEINQVQRERIDALQARHANRIARIRSTVGEQREALSSLETLLETELPPPTSPQPGPVPTESSP